MENNYDILKIIYKEIIGNLSNEEKDILSDWLKNKDNFILYNNIHNREYSEEYHSELKKYNHKNAYKEFRKYTFKQRYKLNIYWKVASVIVVLIGLYLIFSNQIADNDSSGTMKDYIVYENAILTKSSGEVILLGVNENSDSLKLKQIKDNVKWDVDDYLDDYLTTKFDEIFVPKRGAYSFKLSDGSVVHLNSESKLRFPTTFSKKERRVFLEGEAFFIVAADKSNPFIVETSHNSVIAVGTSFNIKSYPKEDEIQTTLVSGNVNVSSDGNIKNLTPNTQLLYSKSSCKITIRKVNTELYTSWIDGMFKFEREKLINITNVLERWYNINIVFKSTSIENALFTGDLKRYDNIDKHITMLQATTNEINFTKKGNTIIIDYKK